MRRLIRAFWVVALIGGSDAAAAAGFDAAKIAEIKTAGDAFQALGKDAYKTGLPPRQSDPAVAKLLDTIFGTDVLNGPPPVTFAQFLAVNDWLLQVVNTGLVYVTAGTNIADFMALTSISAEAQTRMNANVIAFAPEIGRYYDAQLAVSRVEIDLVIGELAAHPDDYKSGTKAQGVGEMRSGLAQTLTGVVETFQLPGSPRLVARSPARAPGAGADRSQVPRGRPEAAGPRPRGEDRRRDERRRHQGWANVVRPGDRAVTPCGWRESSHHDPPRLAKRAGRGYGRAGHTGW